jgi:Protein of unknown function (DUF3501)
MSMEAIGLDDLLGRERYGAERVAIRRRVIEHKRSRRVGVGDRMSLLFEDRATVWYQTQEMLWVEHITDLDAVRDELAVYGALLPGASELSATLLIEISEQGRIREELQQLRGIDRHVWLDVAGERVPGVFEEGRESDTKLSAVQYVRFPLSRSARERLVGGAPLAVAVDHPAYRCEAPIPEAVRQSLVSDLSDGEAAGAALRWVRDG